MNNNIRVYSFFREEIVEKKIKLEEAIKHLEIVKCTMIDQLQELTAMEENTYIKQVSMVNDFSIENGVFRFCIEGRLPHFDLEDKKYHQRVRDHYQQKIIQFVNINEIRSLISFNKAFIYLVHIFSNEIPRDLDNRSKKFIFDGIRYSGIIKDDSWKYISYMERGLVGKTSEKVEIWIGDDERKVEIIKAIEAKYVERIRI
ncbi:hypothetical protein ABHN05_13130 [Brevibacillus laterosporus]|uniref:hypothetical protein n=1 Tax=Brevibacillus laterosporus TaxID=1465 RepID=UPI00112B493C|nr:hypothetical protein [Brevibacillus laterosporus]MBG9790983.1 hypothetical protein [Brevibacillus laterosporus]MBG9804894.1 hypothetical protein [Brevibacillus laterosporus]MED1790542.1 hypothetical protein [Brevibacillus laterosporus]MED4762097.1 hypothetical protein [Brevibacillus laterosporus]TPH09959.1 hypothetical protein EGH09_21625 [Brevibacillus laterosporus]